MDAIVQWVLSLEITARDVYLKAAKYFVGNENLVTFLEQLAQEEKWHGEVMTTSEKYFSTLPPKSPAISIDPYTREKIERVFSTIVSQIDSRTLSEQTLINLVASAEFSEWNDVFLYVVNVLKKEVDGFPKIAAKMQNHLRLVQLFLEESPLGTQALAHLKKVPPVWLENILLVDDDPSITALLAAILDGEGAIGTASNGEEALHELGKRDYKLIISDIEMPRMDGLTFYQKATQMFPITKGKFLFLTGNPSPDQLAFFQQQSIKFLIKPAPLAEIRVAALTILLSKNNPSPVCHNHSLPEFNA